MKYTLTQSQEADAFLTLTLSGHLTINNSLSLHAELLEHARQQKGLRLKVQEVEEIDGAFLQLMLSLSKFHEENQKPLFLQLDLSPGQNTLLRVSGANTILTNNF